MLSRGVSLLVLAWVLVGVSTIIVGLRFLARWIRLGRFEIDDYLILLAVVIELAHTAVLTVAQDYGLGAHIQSLSPSNEAQALKYITIQEGLAVASPAFGRVSFAVFLIMLLGPTAWIKRYLLWFLVGGQVIVNIAIIIQIYSQCGSYPSALWDPAVARIAHCESPEVETVFGYVQSAFNSLTDLLLTITPSIIIWELTLPRKAKMGLSLVLGLSLFALAASIVKAVEIRNLAYRNDLTYNMVALQICSVIENNVVMIAASMPKLRPLWKRNATTERSQYQAAYIPRNRQSSKDETQYFDAEDQHEGNNECKFEEAKGDGITKTVDVEIAYRNGSASTASTGEKSGFLEKHAIPEFLYQDSRLR